VIRTLWNGTLELGELVIPVGLASTVRDGREQLRLLHRACKTPIAQRSYCALEEKLLEPDEIVRAFEASPGQFLPVDGDALAVIEPPDSRRIPISGFVTVDEIPPPLVRKRYHLVPSTTIGTQAYALLVAAIADLDVAGVVRFALRKNEQLGAITSRAGVLELAILDPLEDLVEGVGDEVRAIADTHGQIDDRLLNLARELVDRHTRPRQPDDLVSHQRRNVQRLLEKLLAEEPIVRPEPVQEDERPLTADLAGTLKRSVKQAPRRKRGKATTTR
jgi:DNA end-binding protein Ku